MKQAPRSQGDEVSYQGHQDNSQRFQNNQSDVARSEGTQGDEASSQGDVSSSQGNQEEVAGSKGPQDDEAGSQSLHHEVAGMMLEVLSTYAQTHAGINASNGTDKVELLWQMAKCGPVWSAGWLHFLVPGRQHFIYWAYLDQNMSAQNRSGRQGR